MKYKVKFYIDKEMVETRDFYSINDACRAVLGMDCEAFDNIEDDWNGETVLYAEVIDTQTNDKLFWCDTNGERGSNCRNHFDAKVVEYYLDY